MRSNVITALIAIAIIMGAVSCGGGSSAPSTQPESMGENNSVGGADNSTAAVLPATTNQPNTISQHTVTDTSGRNHATYADVDGRVFYATCASVCSSQASWSSVVLGQFDTGLVGNATPKIGVDSSGRIHIAIITDTTSLFTSDVHYASCDNACTQLAGWSIGFAFTLNETFILQDVQFHDWFAVSPSGVPHIALFGSSELFATRRIICMFTNANPIAQTKAVGADNRLHNSI